METLLLTMEHTGITDSSQPVLSYHKQVCLVTLWSLQVVVAVVLAVVQVVQELVDSE